MLSAAFDTHLEDFHLALDLHVEEGKTTVLLGESGAGKSTVLRLLAGLLYPERGHIKFNNIVYYDDGQKSGRRIVVPPQKRPFGYVFQDYVLFPHLTIFENVAFGLRAQRYAEKELRYQVTEILEKVQLSEYAARYPTQLSGGQQQRVAIARALVLRPQLLLLDEPLSALDIQTRREVRQQLRNILSSSHITTVMVTHQYLDALLFGEQILVLEHGQMIQSGGQQELRTAPRSPYIAELVGVNFFHGNIVSNETAPLCTIRLDAHQTEKSEQPIEIVATLKEPARTIDAETATTMPRIGTEAYIVIDPRSITLHRTFPDSSARNIFYGRIMHILDLHTATEPEHGVVRISIALESTTMPLTADITESSLLRMELREGQQIYATFKATEARAYL